MMLFTSLMRFNSKRGFVVAVVCLALMIVALGAAAKHSQFESPFHSTHYLKQSVKMVSDSHHSAIVAPPETSRITLAILTPVPIFLPPVPAFVPAPVPSPLII